MRFADWCEANPTKATALREKLGLKTFHKYRRGDVTRVDPDTIAVICAATAHQVTANDFYDIDPVRTAKATMKLAEAAA